MSQNLRKGIREDTSTLSTQRIEKLTISEAGKVLAENKNKWPLGPPICAKCVTTFSRDRRGWFCGICGKEESEVNIHTWYYKDLNEKGRKKVDENDRWYSFMGMKHERKPRSNLTSDEDQTIIDD